MPTYDYECSGCRRRFEAFQRITAKPAATCPHCGKSARRLISAGAGLLFKGSGFYITDYRSSDYKKRAKSESGSKSEPSSHPKSGPPRAGSSSADKG